MPRRTMSTAHDALFTDDRGRTSRASSGALHLPADKLPTDTLTNDTLTNDMLPSDTLHRDTLPADTPPGFVLLDAITRCDASGLTAVRHCSRTPAWHVVEAMAQAGAMHLRFLGDFSDHAFLLGITDCPWPEAPLDGCYRIEVRLAALTQGAASYDMTLSALDGTGDGIEEQQTERQTAQQTERLTERQKRHATMLFGRVPYDATYREAILAPRYRRLFAWLTRSCTA